MLCIKNFIVTAVCLLSVCIRQACAQETYHEQYRPQIHFSPREKWTNDPNGMVYLNGTYHLFFQYYPDSSVWGPMHWGHATSVDLIHWHQEAIALYPDSLGYIFSGSAVFDIHNTSGLGKNGQPPLVAIFTHHDPIGAKQKRNDFQNQSIAYSNDEGKTWIKYDHNPVLKNPGVRDFRDPKVIWYEAGKKWIMTLATQDRITFYSSPDLKTWSKESEFGEHEGAHGGVWECPDLFPLNDHGEEVWILIVNINPGGPNKGSATQYFTGYFDGNHFISSSKETKWLDYGPDEYAGITWSNTGNRSIFLGWMSNWMYANKVPTQVWRNAMTLPRQLTVKHVGKEIYLASLPVQELSKIETVPETMENFVVTSDFESVLMKNKLVTPCRIKIELTQAMSFSLSFSNDSGDSLLIGFDKKLNQYFIDRRNSGKVDFNNGFAAIHVAPRISMDRKMEMELVLDASSVELFADGGLTTMTEIFFPAKPYDQLKSQSPDHAMFRKLDYMPLKSIWP